MTVTDELRAGLTRRGIEWRWEDERTTYWYVTVDGDEWGEWTAIEMGGYLHLSFSSGDVFTPEQAIAATLGRGECRNEGDQSDFLCSECGGRMFTDTDDTYTMIDSLGNIIEQPKYCPNCGRRIVEVD